MKRLLKPLVAVMLVIFVVAGCTVPAAPIASVPPTATPGPLDVVAAFRAARAQHDVDKMVALFTDDARCIYGGVVTLNGHDGIRRILGYAEGLRHEELEGDCEMTPNQNLVECNIKVKMLPYGEYKAQYRLEVVGDRIKTMYYDEYPGASGDQQFEEFVAWGSTIHPDEWKPLWDRANTADWDLALGQSFAKLYDEWQASLLTPTPAPVATDPLDVVQAYRDALAQRDVDAMLAVFTEGAYLQHVDGVSHTGKAELRDFFDYMIVLEFTEPAVECKAGVALDFAECKGKFDAIAFGGYEAGYTVQIKEGKIDKFYWALYSWPDQPRFMKLRTWALAAYPEELALYDKKVSSFAYDRELGELLKWLYDEWKASQK